MKNFFDGLKDLFYDYIDTLLVVAIVLIVSGTIMWRLDILFASDLAKDTLKPIEVVSEEEEGVTKENNEKEENDEKDNVEDINEDENAQDEEENSQEEEKPNIDNNEEDTNKPEEVTTIVVDIPSGSLGPTIGDILVKKGLINDKWEFLRRAQELGLDTKLKSGTFKIKSDSSLDIIIKTISRNL